MISKKALLALATSLGGMPVLSCLPGSPAARAGIRYGDIVLSVNGRPTPTVDDYVEASLVRKGGMDVVIFRAGVMERFDLTYDDADSEPRRLESVIAEMVEQRVLSEFPGPPGEEPGEA